jgi:hypothetical protein
MPASTPEMMAAGFNLAGYHIEAGARRFADYAKAPRQLVRAAREPQSVSCMVE